MKSNLRETELDDFAPLGRAFVEFREALYSPRRSKARVESSAAQFAETVQSQFQNKENAFSGESIANARRFGRHADALLADETALLEQVQAISSLAHSGVETLGWWHAMQQRFDDLASHLSNLQTDEEESLESELSRTGNRVTK